MLSIDTQTTLWECFLPRVLSLEKPLILGFIPSIVDILLYRIKVHLVLLGLTSRQGNRYVFTSFLSTCGCSSTLSLGGDSKNGCPPYLSHKDSPMDIIISYYNICSFAWCVATYMSWCPSLTLAIGFGLHDFCEGHFYRHLDYITWVYPLWVYCLSFFVYIVHVILVSQYSIYF